ncbi:Sodium channel protein 60E [Orchesella cincta]|uniref:Sodium channel protein n=1 Tax=Orchesella cincta TaxID=48709 RepID=A0A1D2NEG6_ORCCI|nr:Sodium channel protein 60E [Orchesella cincta]
MMNAIVGHRGGGRISGSIGSDNRLLDHEVSMPAMNDSWLGKPVEEVDALIYDDTFCVISKKYERHYIFRYSTQKFAVPSRANESPQEIRHLHYHSPVVDILIIITILSNCVTLAMITNEFGFLAIYTLELVLKVLAKGLLLNRFSYLRNPFELFSGRLRSKCVIIKGGPQDKNRNTPIDVVTMGQEVADKLWNEWVNDWKNWKQRDFPNEEPVFCGNSSDMRQCGNGYTCIGLLGNNPNKDGYHLTTSLNYWERVYDLVVSTNGALSLLFFLLVIFLGAYYLLNLMLAVVAMSYENEARLQDQGYMTCAEKLRKVRKKSNFSFDDLAKINICKMTHYRKRTKSEIEMKAKRLKVTHDDDEDRQTGVEYVDTIFGLIGMHMTLGMQADTDDKVRLASVSSLAYDPFDRDQSFVDNHDDDNIEDLNNEETKPGDKSESDVDIDAEREIPVDPSSLRMRYMKVTTFLSTWLRPIVFHRVFEYFITFCIIANTIVLGLEHHGQSKIFDDHLQIGNYIFMAIFTAEAIIKILALQSEYFGSGWNIFDFVIVGLSYLDFCLDYFKSGGSAGGNGLSVIRSFRLLRVFKLAQSWITMKVLLNIIFSSFGALGNLTCVLFIIIYIFAVTGMQIIGGEYKPAYFSDDVFPTWHWQHFWYAFMMVFRVLCGEWIEPLWDCLHAQQHYLTAHPDQSSYLCFSIFLPILIVGNFIVLNLFLALLLNSFDSEELNAQRDKELEASGRTENLKNIVGLLLKKGKSLALSKADSDHHHDHDQDHDHDHDIQPSTSMSAIPAVSVTSAAPVKETIPKVEEKTEPVPPPVTVPVKTPSLTRSKSKSQHSKATLAGRRRFKKLIHKVMIKQRTAVAERVIARVERKHALDMYQTETKMFLRNPAIQQAAGGFHSDVKTIVLQTTPGESLASEHITHVEDCFPKKYILLCCPNYDSKPKVWKVSRWNRLRAWCVRVVQHPTFEGAILLLIVASSITLCFEDIYLENNRQLKWYLCVFSFCFSGIFFVEMILKWFAIGIYGYFTNFWTILDGFIVLVSCISLYFDITTGACSISPPGGKISTVHNLEVLKALRTLRALRPLRAISRWQGMKIVVNSLMYAIPSIFNVLLVCLLFWLIFSIMAVQFFKGQFYKCVDKDGETVSHILVPNKEVCCAKAATDGYSWINTPSNFDNVFEGYLSLFQVATFEGWIELMESSVNAAGIDVQPVRDNQIEYYAFYVAFIIFGSFFTLQLFIGVIIDNFNMLKKKYEGNTLEMLLTPSQRNYYIAMKNLGKRKPKKVVKRPKAKFFSFFYSLAMSKKLEVCVYIVIFLNTIAETFQHYDHGNYHKNILDACNAFFFTFYVIEAAIKLTGLGYFYFTVPWNIYDMILLFASLMDVCIHAEIFVEYPIPPSLLRIVRIVRIGRVLRLVKAAKGIRKLLFALVVSLPALFNIGALLGLITFIYAVLGMALFGKAPLKDAVDETFNFRTFFSSNLLLLRLMTAAGWNEVLESLTVITPVCGHFRPIECGLPGEPECPRRAIVVGYIVSYVVFTYLIVINLYIAIILENYVEASNEEDVGIVEDDLEMFYVRWAKFDPNATQFIRFIDLFDFLDSLDPPLRIPKPNMIAVVAFNLPIARGNTIHCLDILHSLIKHVLGKVDDSPDFRKLQRQMEVKFQKQFPSRSFLDIVSSTRIWKVEHNAALKIQKAWRRYIKKKHQKEISQIVTVVEHREEIPIVSITAAHGGLGHMMRRMGNIPNK